MSCPTGRLHHDRRAIRNRRLQVLETEREPSRTTWQTELSFDRRVECTDELAEPTAMVEAFYTPCRSEVKPR